MSKASWREFLEQSLQIHHQQHRVQAEERQWVELDDTLRIHPLLLQLFFDVFSFLLLFLVILRNHHRDFLFH